MAAASSAVGYATVQQHSVSSRSSTSSLKLTNSKMPLRSLGKTGVQVPILGLGGAGQTPLSDGSQEKAAIALVERALELGIRYFDTAASYGPSEDFLGKVLPPYRQQIFLASKTGMRDRDEAWRQLERSLKRLQTDYLDLWQMHSVSDQEALNTLLSRNGAIRALEEAKRQKIIRFGGITGHHEPSIIVEGLRRYSFDTALIPLNPADAHHPRPFAPAVLPVAKQKQVGVIAMKVPAYGRLFKPGGLSGMQEAMGYALSLSSVNCCIIAAESVSQLEANVRVAETFKPLSSDAIATLEQRVAGMWEDNTFFRAWS
jgi:aryl-alcohol dehydrogenase-like predicted oxidoreductase